MFAKTQFLPPGQRVTDMSASNIFFYVFPNDKCEYSLITYCYCFFVKKPNFSSKLCVLTYTSCCLTLVRREALPSPRQTSRPLLRSGQVFRRTTRRRGRGGADNKGKPEGPFLTVFFLRRKMRRKKVTKLSKFPFFLLSITYSLN